jgi:hypothetical protein
VSAHITTTITWYATRSVEVGATAFLSSFFFSFLKKAYGLLNRLPDFVLGRVRQSCVAHKC